MIRRDYILRMIEQFVQALTRLRSLQQQQQWQEADVSLDEQLKRFTGHDLPSLLRQSETELLSSIIKGEPSLAVREKALVVSSLLKEAGDIATAQNRDQESRSCYLKGLHLLLDALKEGETFEFPEFAPRVEMFLSALKDTPLPLHTRAGLMQHYERSGEFAKAEDALFSMLDDEPANPGLLDFGISFYQRILNQTDDNLIIGNLPRDEVEASLAELRTRRASPKL